MINLEKRPEKSTLFSGESTIARLDLSYDSQFKKLAETDEANVWFLNVVSCSQDRWDEMPSNALSKFRKTLAYQTLLDSTVPDIFKHLSAIADDPWLEYLYSRISTMEHTHAMSYSSGVDQAFGAKASEFLDIIYTDEKIKDRVKDELEIATKFIQSVKAGWHDSEENHKILLEALFIVFLLEGIKFPFSFFTSWTLNKGHNNCAQGFSQLLIKIATDEMQVHTTLGATVLKKAKKSDQFKYLFDSGWFEEMATKVTETVRQKEKEWAAYLLEDGEVPGFNQAICDHFIDYWIARRQREIGLPITVDIQKNDIEEWFDSYRNINNKQAALQEIDNISYQVAQLRDDLSKFDTLTTLKDSYDTNNNN